MADYVRMKYSKFRAGTSTIMKITTAVKYEETITNR